MQIFRTSVAHVLAFSLIAGQLLCGCVADSVQASLIEHTASYTAAIIADAPCHGEPSEPIERDAGSEHDCAHCETVSVAGSVAEAPIAILIGERDSPDSGPLTAKVFCSVASFRQTSDTSPPLSSNPYLAETLVAQHILLLV